MIRITKFSRLLVFGDYTIRNFLKKKKVSGRIFLIEKILQRTQCWGLEEDLIKGSEGLCGRWALCFLAFLRTNTSQREIVRSMHRSHLYPPNTGSLKTWINLIRLLLGKEQREAPGKWIQVPWEVTDMAESLVWHIGLCRFELFWFVFQGVGAGGEGEFNMRNEDSMVSKDTLGLWRKGSPGPDGTVF